MIEEFGLSKRFFGDVERKVVFAVVAYALVAAKQAGKPLMGAMFWQAATSSECGVRVVQVLQHFECDTLACYC